MRLALLLDYLFVSLEIVGRKNLTCLQIGHAHRAVDNLDDGLLHFYASPDDGARRVPYFHSWHGTSLRE